MVNLNPHAGSSLPRSYLPHVAIWMTCKKETKSSERIPKNDMVKKVDPDIEIKGFPALLPPVQRLKPSMTTFINGGDSPI